MSMSRFVISFLLFVLINLWTAQVGGEKINVIQQIDKDAVHEGLGNENTWTKWALLDYTRQRNRGIPIVFLGSSLVLTPINLADANFLHQYVDGALHHESALFSYLLKKSTAQEIGNFNFALPGLMPSDAFLISKLLLQTEDHPQLFIYGVGPRDFVDNLLAGPASTDPYHYLANLMNDTDDAILRMSFRGHDWQSQLDYFIAQHCSLYGQRQIVGERLISCLKGKISQSIMLANKLSIAKIHEFLPTYNPMYIGVKQCLFSPEPSQIDPNRFARDFNEYRLRYRRVNWDTYTCQTEFFLNVLKMANKAEVKTLIVAMPITSTNRQLLPEYVYSAYKKNLRVLANTYSCSFLDLDNGYFSDDDFADTVHLNTAGSIKFMHMLASYVSDHALWQPKEQKNSTVHLANTGVKI